ncbi:MAG: YdcF family protein [Cyanobacteria bacterium J06600_6]
MFLFISKLLPLFVYPLGLSCLLLIWALWLSRKRSRKTYLPILVALIILTIASNPIVGKYAITSLEHQYLPPVPTPKADAIVILGGATRNNEPPRIMPDVSDRGDRLIYGAKLYQEGAAPKIVLTGGRVSWYGGESSEAESMADILELFGIPRTDMILESRALNTHDNAIYTQEILQREKIDKVLLVTSAAHMPRSIAIFRRANINAIPAPTDFMISDRNLVEYRHSSAARILNLIPSSESLDQTTQALKEYIGIVIYRLKGWL